MNAIHPIPKPCTTVEEWLAHHAATKCPSGYAAGLSELEQRFGTARNGLSWNAQIGADVAAAKQKRLRSGGKSRT